jgi:hydroxyethylthiazole kinase
MQKKKLVSDIIASLLKIREGNPLIHQITNFVSARGQANITLSLGAIPVMAEHPGELEDILTKTRGLLLNTGTINKEKTKLYIRAAGIARKREIPVVLDPVGVGTSLVRRKLVHNLLQEGSIDIIKGNLGEIKALMDGQDNNTEILSIKNNVYGVDFIPPAGNYLEGDRRVLQDIKEFSCKYQLTTVVTGERDFITDGEHDIFIGNGSPLFKKITGSGCMTGSLITAFLAVNHRSIVAAAGGVLVMGIAGELSAKDSKGPGTFQQYLFDNIYNLTPDRIHKLERIEII